MWEMTAEQRKAFEKEMSICKQGNLEYKCIDPENHNLGCYCCPIEAGIYEHKKPLCFISANKSNSLCIDNGSNECKQCKFYEDKDVSSGLK
jgi:hypothetical protein